MGQLIRTWETVYAVCTHMMAPAQSRQGIAHSLQTAKSLWSDVQNEEAKGAPADIVLRLRLAITWVVSNAIAVNAYLLIKREQNAEERERLVHLLDDAERAASRFMLAPGVADAVKEGFPSGTIIPSGVPYPPLVRGGFA